MSSPSTCWKTRYSSRSDMAAIMPNRWRPSITAGQQRAPRSGTPQADVAALATTTNAWRATQVRRYGRTDVVQITEMVGLWYGSFAAAPCGLFWFATTSLGLGAVTIVVMLR